MIPDHDPLGLAGLSRWFHGTPLGEPDAATGFLASIRHGDLQRWLELLAGLPCAEPSSIDLAKGVRIGSATDIDQSRQDELRRLLQMLIPWRKGPFSLFDVIIDSEWQSNLKWDRLVSAIQPLHQRKVLDVGCGNGYHCLRSIGEGAELVVGLEPHLIYVMQFRAIAHYLKSYPCFLLPIRLEQFPGPFDSFDTVFSMGVIYHQKSPFEHLILLKSLLRKGGELVLETLVVDGIEGYCLTPKNKYARMSNVWFVPSIQTLFLWLERVGFVNIRLIDTSVTGGAEQRKTDWMPFESLEDSLNLTIADLTIEDLPAPKRAIILANRPD